MAWSDLLARFVLSRQQQPTVDVPSIAAPAVVNSETRLVIPNDEASVSINDPATLPQPNPASSSLDPLPENFDREGWLKWMQQAQKNLALLFALLAVLSCWTESGVNNFTAKEGFSGVLNKAWVSTTLALVLTTLWDTMNVVFAVLISPDYFKDVTSNPSGPNRLKAWFNLLFHLCFLAPAIAWATYSIVRQQVTKEPGSSVAADVGFAGSEAFTAMVQLQKYLQESNSEESRKIFWTMMASVLCAVGASFGAESMVSTSRVPVITCAAFYVAHAAAHNQEQISQFSSWVSSSVSSVLSNFCNSEPSARQTSHPVFPSASALGSFFSGAAATNLLSSSMPVIARADNLQLS